MHTLHYLTGYPSQIQQQAQALLDQGRLGDYLLQRYPDTVSYTHLTLPTRRFV